jgi:DNA-directed RNA polymerase specialized sigma24 family protein
MSMPSGFRTPADDSSPGSSSEAASFGEFVDLTAPKALELATLLLGDAVEAEQLVRHCYRQAWVERELLADLPRVRISQRAWFLACVRDAAPRWSLAAVRPLTG